MTQERPITPPPELVEQWSIEVQHYTCNTPIATYIATQAARWGADQELGACCEWMAGVPDFYTGSEIDLRAARRPNPQNLKEQALDDLDALMSELDKEGNYSDCAQRIRRALELLPDDAQ